MEKRNILLVVTLVAGVFLSVIFVSAQQPQHHPPPMDPLRDAMFPPEMIMQHTRDLALTEEQRAFMRGEIQKTTMRFNELQWQLQDAVEALHDSMKANPVNEQQALAQLDKVLDAEREIKRLHLGLAISIKNRLTAEQQAKLHAFMMQMHPPDGGPGRGPGEPGGGPGGPGDPPRQP
jgi:Spy/CpxP family protein refolding chaperone